MNVTCFTNQGGGVGKTAVCVHLATAIAMSEKKKVLVIDLDPQSSATHWLGGVKEAHPTVAEFLKGETTAEQVIIPTEQEGLFLMPAQFTSLSAYVNGLATMPLGVLELKNHIEEIDEDFDYIFLDTPPGTGIVVSSALMASNNFIIPVNCTDKAKTAVQQTAIAAGVVAKHNQGLRLGGVVCLRVDYRTRDGVRVLGEIQTEFAKSYLGPPVPEYRPFMESFRVGRPIQFLRYSSNATKAYRQMAANFVKRNPVD